MQQGTAYNSCGWHNTRHVNTQSHIKQKFHQDNTKHLTPAATKPDFSGLLVHWLLNTSSSSSHNYSNSWWSVANNRQCETLYRDTKYTYYHPLTITKSIPWCINCHSHSGFVFSTHPIIQVLTKVFWPTKGRWHSPWIVEELQWWPSHRSDTICSLWRLMHTAQAPAHQAAGLSRCKRNTLSFYSIL